MALYMRYQNGVEIDTDNMTYEELLELEEKMGKVSKGITEEQFAKIAKINAKGVEELCSVCYNDINEDEEINQLPCQHCYHVDCIKEWLRQERTCPLCKQEILEYI